MLICPICKTPLHREGSSLYCERGRPHCYDIAKSGYATLTSASGSSGDDRDMVRARTAFLDSGAYEPLAAAVTTALDGCNVIIDAGCGEGYYDEYIVSHRTGVSLYGFDLSKSACDHAAKRLKRLGGDAFFGVSGIFSLPVADASCDAVVSMFAPIAEREFRRVLRPDGLLIVAAAGRRHLYELKAAIYEEAYENDVRRDLPEGFRLEGRDNIVYQFDCGGENLTNLFRMTPYVFRTSSEDAAKLGEIGSLVITADFELLVYKKSAE